MLLITLLCVRQQSIYMLPKQQVHIVYHEPMALQKTINLVTLHFYTPQPLSQTQLRVHARARVFCHTCAGQHCNTIILT